MEELEPTDDQKPRCSVKELVARIQQKQQNEATNYEIRTDRSESSDDDDGHAYRSHHHQSGALSPPPFETMPVDAPPRSRCGVYSPATVQAEIHHEVTPVYRYEIRNTDLNTRFAKLRMLEGAGGVSKEIPGRVLNVGKMYEHPQDVGDNNDSGYSTKVYGSSKGNSPSLSGEQGEGECMRSSSLV